MTNHLKPFHQLSRKEREAVLLGWSSSLLKPKRQAFDSFKSLFAQKMMTGLRPDGTNIACEAMGYDDRAEDPYHEPAPAFEMLNRTMNEDAELTVDVVIVGSGCGGGVVAATLAKAGQRVLVLEKGPHYDAVDLPGREGPAFNELYEAGGAVLTDTGISVLAGASFGGGTTVNWACCLRTPHYVREEWAKEHGLEFVAGREYSEALEAVCERLSVKEEGVAHNHCNRLLLEGCKAIGCQASIAPQNMRDTSAEAVDAGRISIGDRQRNKQCGTETYLDDARRHGAQFMDRCKVDIVTHSRGVATGVSGTFVGQQGQTRKLNVRAKVVVVSGGAINSPALLLRSKVPNRHIGSNLRLHPVSAIKARIPAHKGPVDVWSGAPMTTVREAVAGGRRGDGYGCKLECPSMHPGLIAATTPWHGCTKYKLEFLKSRRIAAIISLCRDKGSGTVSLDERGEPALSYPLANEDIESLIDGLELSMRIFSAAGAEALGTSQKRFFPDNDCFCELGPEEDTAGRRENLNTAIETMKECGIALDNRSQVFSAHQMGTCRMGADKRSSVVDLDGQSWEIQNLYVADASVFPTSSGANPMITTLAMSHCIAQRLVAKVKSCQAGQMLKAAL